MINLMKLFSLIILGTSNDSWTGGSIVSQLNPDILVKIQHCFMGYCSLIPKRKPFHWNA